MIEHLFLLIAAVFFNAAQRIGLVEEINVFLSNLVPGLLCWNRVINSVTIDELSNAQHSADGHVYLITCFRG